eukprot:INCI13972.1.p1 GENE.INCI13972.1~~INCI13972.1.p1  ORF type:complete len:414 (-),score=44.79 INCI13972.1:1213-2454(-)
MEPSYSGVREKVGEVTKDMRGKVKEVTDDVRGKVKEMTAEVRGKVVKARGKWRRAVTGDENTAVRSHLRGKISHSASKFSDKARQTQEELVEKYRNTQQQLVKRARTAVTGDENKRISDLLKEPTVVRTFDKLSFMLGVMTLLGTEFFILKLPQTFDLWYLGVFGTLMALRFRIYNNQGLQYFLWDFCYFCNLMAWLLLAFRYFERLNGWSPLSPQWEVAIWQAVFVLSMGPLVWAIVIWRNSLVFHSFDKVTSVFIHLLPALLLHGARFEMPEGAVPDFCAVAAKAGNPDCSMDSPTCVWLPLAIYLGWQVVYVIKVDIMDAKKFAADPTLTSSTRWIVKDRRNGFRNAVVRVCKKMGVMRPDEDLNSEEWKTKFIFMGTQLVFTVITVLPAYLCYHFYIWSIGARGVQLYV